MKTTRTENNKPSQSTPIRKGKISPEEIKRTAEELTKNQLTTTGSAIKTYRYVNGGELTLCDKDGKSKETRVVELVEAPKIEPVEHGNYEIYSEYVKAHCKVHDTYETTGDELKKMFPQRNYGGQVAMHLKRYYGLSYRRVENGRNDTYVFFVEPTREELMRDYQRRYDRRGLDLQELGEENSQLKSELFYSQIITLAFAIGAVITIIIKSVAL